MTSRSYLVTGASTGIGRTCVDQLVGSGARVWATVRSDEDEESLSKAHGDAVQVLRMDLTDADSIAAAGERVRAGGPLHGLVNNAGMAMPAPLEYIPMDLFRRQIEVNLIGQLAVTQAMLPALRQADGARIVFIGSIAGRIAGSMLGAYHVSKFGLVGLADTLRAELAPSGIRVVLIEPGPIATPIWKRSASLGDQLVNELPPEAVERYQKQIEAAIASANDAARRAIPADRAAQIIIAALTDPNPRPRQLVGRDAKVASIVARLPYRLRYRLTAAKR